MDGGHPGGFDHGGAQVASPLFGDAPLGVRLARSMDAAPSTGIATPLRRVCEALNIPHGGQDNHRGQHPDAGLLHQERDVVGPGFAHTGLVEGCLHLLNQRCQQVQELQVLSE